MASDQVTIIFDATFGEKAIDQAARGPIWIVRSAENEQAIKSLWADPKTPPDHATIFDAQASSEPALLSVLADVDEHHFAWTKIEVVGVVPSTAIENALDEYGPGSLQRTKQGFVFNRRTPHD